jgi:uncharacterized protein DUF6130
MDSVRSVWFHVPQEHSMSPFDRWNCHVAMRVETIASAAMMVLALSAVSVRHAGLAAQTSTGADAKATVRSAKEVRGATPYIELKNEPPPRLIVDAPLPDLLNQGVVWIQWRAENVHILPVFGKGALSASPRIGHLHVHVDDLPWWWADPSNVNTIDLAGMPPGPHKILIELVDANHEVFPGQSKMVTFTVAKGAPRPHGH